MSLVVVVTASCRRVIIITALVLGAGGFQRHSGLDNALPFCEIQQAARGRKANLVLYGACREDAAPYM